MTYISGMEHRLEVAMVELEKVYRTIEQKEVYLSELDMLIAKETVIETRLFQRLRDEEHTSINEYFSRLDFLQSEVDCLLSEFRARKPLVPKIEVGSKPIPLNKRKLVLPPGQLFLKISEILVSKKRYEQSCLPAIADWREEYYEALDQNRSWVKFTAIRIRHTWAFAKTLLLLGLFAALGKLIKSMISGK